MPLIQERGFRNRVRLRLSNLSCDISGFAGAASSARPIRHAYLDLARTRARTTTLRVGQMNGGEVGMHECARAHMEATMKIHPCALH